MTTTERDRELRQMASVRGFKLVKSRRRTPGRGDYGRYGLSDAKTDEPCFGFGKRGLTATSDEIVAWLEGQTEAGWRNSLRSPVRRTRSKSH